MKQIIMLAVMAITAIVGFAADSQVAADMGGKTKDGLVWKVTRRDFTPGYTEVEINVGRDVNKNTRLSIAYVMDDKQREFVGPILQQFGKSGRWAYMSSVTVFIGVGNDSNLRLIQAVSTKMDKNTSAGACILWAKMEGRKPYWEAGPFVRLKLAENVSLQIQPIIKVGDKEGVNIFLSTTL